MQSYALSRRLSELHKVDVEIIDYMSARMDTISFSLSIEAKTVL